MAKASVRASSRAAADLQRKVAKQRVKVNRTVPAVTAPSLEVAFGIHVTTDALRRAHVLAEPLLPTAVPTDDDNRALATLLQTVATVPEDQRLVRIDQFLADRPASPWRASVLANAATSYARAGYFSRAAAYWEQAWELTKDATSGDARAIADYSVGEALTQMITFGQVERIEKRLKEIETRDVRGPAGTKVSAARIALSVLTNHHELAMFSGPEALKMYLTVAPTATLEKSVRTIAAYHPSMEGTRIHELRNLAASAGLQLSVVHAAPVGDIPVPSVVHFRSQHYAAIVAREGDTYVLRDPSLGGTLRLTGAALRDETSGYFLVPPDISKNPRWRAVADGEAANVVGHCTPGANNYDPPCPDCGGPGPGGDGGMPHYAFHPVSASLIVEDAPLGTLPPSARQSACACRTTTATTVSPRR